MAIDERRHPHYGGRKRPGECGNCGRTVLVSVIDTPDDDGEGFCGQCIPEAIDIAWQQAREALTRPNKTDSMWSFEDETCADRTLTTAGVELSHVRDGRYNCIYCGVRLYQRRRGG